MKYDVIVLGSGPGGYVTAIRASQLGFKVAVIEKENLGGVCLNWGCIPTKALLKSAQVFDYLKHASDYGLSVSSFDKDFTAVVGRSRGIADGMSKGVQFLMKKNKIDVIDGFGKVKPGKKIDVTAADGKVTEYTADNIIIATGARSRELPNLPQDGVKVIGYRKAMTLEKQPKSMIAPPPFFTGSVNQCRNSGEQPISLGPRCPSIMTTFRIVPKDFSSLTICHILA